MAGDVVVFDTTEFDKRTAVLDGLMDKASLKAAEDIADEVMRLSGFEVPHDTGMLQASGHVEVKKDEVIAGYNKVYAARLHEHPEYHFQKGRKGKYLEDPIKHNLSTFQRVAGLAIQVAINSGAVQR